MTRKVLRKYKTQSDAPNAILELPSWPFFTEEEIELASAVLRSGKVNYWTGDQVKCFEKEFSKYCHRAHGLAVPNGTLALEMAMHMLELAPGDEVIVPCRGFIACASSVIRAGGVPIFADIDRKCQNLTTDTIEQAITHKTRAILYVHLGGWPGDMNAVVELSRHHQLDLIEDCSQAHGARWKEIPVGKFGDIAVFSFCQDKIMTTAGEGGIVLTDRKDYFERAFALRDHGRDVTPQGVCDQSIDTEFIYCRNSIGSNYRLTEVQAAVGRSQLKRLNKLVDARRRNAGLLHAKLGQLPAIRWPLPPAEAYHSFYRCYFFLRPQLLNSDWDRARVLATLNESGVPAHVGACPEIYLEHAIDASLRPSTKMTTAIELGETSIALPVHPGLQEAHMKQIAAITYNVIDMATDAQAVAHE